MTSASTWLALAIATVGGVLYHVAARSIPKDLPPALVLVAAYATALVISAAAHAAVGLGPATSVTRLLHPAVLGLGAGAAMIEIGYVLIYRAAWPVSVTSIVVNGTVAAILVLVGMLAFGERMSAVRAAGIALCLGGVWLLRR
jgi:drug/metabolite transporter (DMT)-like permease